MSDKIEKAILKLNSTLVEQNRKLSGIAWDIKIIQQEAKNLQGISSAMYNIKHALGILGGLWYKKDMQEEYEMPEYDEEEED